MLDFIWFSLLQYVLPVITVVILLGVTIFVHELGHYAAARRVRMIVDVFSLGFGPAVWRKRRKGTTYKIGWFPVGGYVALPQMEPMSAERRAEVAQQRAGRAEEEKTALEKGYKGATFNALPAVSPWKKIAVSLSGALGNVALAVVIAWLIYLVGKPATPGECSSTVGYVDAESALYAKGLRIGDEIVKVNGEEVGNWQEVLLAGARYKEVVMTVRKKNGEIVEYDVPTTRTEIGFRTIAGIDEVSVCRVAGVMPDSGAEAAELKVGDVVKRYDGRDVISRAHLSALVQEKPGALVPVVIERGGRILQKKIKSRVYPEYDGRALVGIKWDLNAVDRNVIVHPRPGAQLRGDALAIVRFLKALVTPAQAKAAAQGVGGPVSILAMLWLQVKAGLIIALAFTRFLNVNLAIINLLPIPVLDGGHILFSLWEVVSRRPANDRFVAVLVNTFAVLIVGLLLFITYRDVNLFRKLHHSRAEPAETTETNAVPGPAVQDEH